MQNDVIDFSLCEQEDELVIKLVKEFGDKSWVVLAPHVGTRTAKQIRERWHNHLDSNIKKVSSSDTLYVNMRPLQTRKVNDTDM